MCIKIRETEYRRADDRRITKITKLSTFSRRKPQMDGVILVFFGSTSQPLSVFFTAWLKPYPCEFWSGRKPSATVWRLCPVSDFVFPRFSWRFLKGVLQVGIVGHETVANFFWDVFGSPWLNKNCGCPEMSSSYAFVYDCCHALICGFYSLASINGLCCADVFRNMADNPASPGSTFFQDSSGDFSNYEHNYIIYVYIYIPEWYGYYIVLHIIYI